MATLSGKVTSLHTGGRATVEVTHGRGTMTTTLLIERGGLELDDEVVVTVVKVKPSASVELNTGIAPALDHSLRGVPRG